MELAPCSFILSPKRNSFSFKVNSGTQSMNKRICFPYYEIPCFITDSIFSVMQKTTTFCYHCFLQRNSIQRFYWIDCNSAKCRLNFHNKIEILTKHNAQRTSICEGMVFKVLLPQSPTTGDCSYVAHLLCKCP